MITPSNSNQELVVEGVEVEDGNTGGTNELKSCKFNSIRELSIIV